VARHRLERVEVDELDVHGPKKYLIVTIMTIDFPDDPSRAIMRSVDMNPYFAEMVARERLDCARVVAARRRLLRGPAAPGLAPA
jgi:hypothetical protein